MSDEHYPEWHGVDWGEAAQRAIAHQKERIAYERDKYRALYPEWGDAIDALIHNEKVIRDLEEQVDTLKAKNKRLKKILRRAIK